MSPPLRETTLADIEPPNGAMSYDPGGRYCLLAVWGYALTTGASGSRPVFSIIDTITGVEREWRGPVNHPRHEHVAGELRQRVDALNAEDAAWDAAS